MLDEEEQRSSGHAHALPLVVLLAVRVDSSDGRQAVRVDVHVAAEGKHRQGMRDALQLRRIDTPRANSGRTDEHRAVCVCRGDELLVCWNAAEVAREPLVRHDDGPSRVGRSVCVLQLARTVRVDVHDPRRSA